MELEKHHEKQPEKQHPEDLVASLSGTFVHTAAVIEGVLRTTMYICNCNCFPSQ